jgi:hypothetical protein
MTSGRQPRDPLPARIAFCRRILDFLAPLPLVVRLPFTALRALQEASCQVEFTNLYGEAFDAVLTAKPRSVFIASGSDVTVYRGRRLGSTARSKSHQKL